VADIARMQLDSKSLLAETYMALFKGLSSENPDVQTALMGLRSWEDLQLRRDSVPAALFEIFRMHLAYAVLGDDVGRQLVPTFASDVLFHQLARDPESMWWDKADTQAAETPGDIILEALSNTVDWFKAHAGDDMNQWTWGRLHTATFVSAPLGQTGIGLVERLVNRGPFPVDGGSGVVNTQSWRWSDPARVTVNVSMRMIVDFANFDASRAILPTGQSGHPYHRNYADMIPLWLNGEYHPMLFTRPAVEAAATAHVVLRPQD
jgi:penicillin amidase